MLALGARVWGRMYQNHVQLVTMNIEAAAEDGMKEPATTARRPSHAWSPNILVRSALAITGACTLVYALTSLALPFGWDHDIIASVGSSYLGGLPYVDSWDIKGPTAYLPFALAQILFGHTMWGVRLLDIAIWAIAGFHLYKSVAILTTRPIGIGTTLATYLWIASSGWFFTAAPESWVTASCVVAIVPLVSSGSSFTVGRLALAGFLIACAGLVKPFYFAFGLAPLAAVGLATDLGVLRRGKLALILAAGAVVPVILICGYFAARGGLSQAIQVHLLYPLSTYAGAVTGWSTTFHGVAAFVKAPPIIVLAPFVLLGLWFYRTQMRIMGPLLAWLGVAFLCVALQGKYWIYHWFPSYPPLFILGALGVFALLQTRKRPGVIQPVVGLCSALILMAVVWHPMQDAAKLGYYLILKRDPEGYNASHSFRLYNAGDEIAVARYIAAHSGPQQGLFIWGSDALYYLADRPNPTRFTFLMPLTMPGPYRAAYRAEAMRDLKAHPPMYFVTGISWDGLSKATTELPDFPTMSNFLSQRYYLEKSIGILSIYRRRSEPSSALAYSRSTS